MSKILFIVFVIIASTPFVIGLLLTCILCIIPFSIRGKSVKGGFRDCLALFNDLKNMMI